MHILIAVDDSESSKYAFQWTLTNFIPSQSNGEESGEGKRLPAITLLTVVEPPAQASYYYAASGAIYSASFLDEIYQKATDKAAAVVRNFHSLLVAHNSLIKMDMIVGRGEVRDEIVDYAASAKVDLVVMGSRGLGALKRAFIGSTSDYVVHHAHCPVLVVKQPATPSTEQ